MSMKNLKSKSETKICNKIIAFLIVVSMMLPLSGTFVQAADYPRIYDDEMFIDAIAGNNVNITYEIWPAYQNEILNIKIYDSAGRVIKQASQQFRNVYDTPFKFTVSWNTAGIAPGEYKVVAVMDFYTYYSWHTAPTSETTYITLYPKKQAVKSVKAQSGRKLKVKWKKDSQADGYQIQYSTNKNFNKELTTVTVSKNKTTQKLLTNLRKGKKYFVRVRSFKNDNGRIYGEWSKTKKSKTIR